LIEKQQVLIALLKEKRQAVISHAVTKGLNPNTPLKPSGIEWLGDVPEHWEVISFSQCVSITGGLVDPRIEPYKEYTMIAPNHIESKSGRILKLETAEEQGAESGKYLCEKNGVIYSKIRPALAKACICPEEHVLCSADMYPMQGILGMTNSYLFRLLLTDEFTAFTIMESDRVAMPKMNRESLGSTRLPIPPEAEQNEIAKHIEKSCTQIDKLVSIAKVAELLLQERRTALISAAVTGKIDVRHWQEPETNDE
jgi:type I restriction enzyme S subunit